MIKILLISGGTITLLVGLAGIFIPVLPTTPFVLLSAGLYVRSSPVLYNRIMTSRLTLPPVPDKGSGRKAGITALIIMWTMIVLTAIFIVDSTWLRVLLVLAGVTGTSFKIRYFFMKNSFLKK